MRKFGRAAATAAGAASLLAVAFMASAYTPGSAAMAAPAATKAGRLAQVRPGGPMALPGNRPSAPWTFSGKTVNIVSQNWGGYVAQQHGVKFRYVRATFFVPYVDCASTPSSFSGHWVGLDGAGSATVEQDGILAACEGATPTYSAWYEMFPLPPVYSTMTVRPGNSIVASSYYDSGTGKFTLSLTDTTNGEHFTHTLSCPSGSQCQRLSAEVISEAPSSGSRHPAADQLPRGKLQRHRRHRLPRAAGRAARALVGHLRRGHGEQRGDAARPAHPGLPRQGLSTATGWPRADRLQAGLSHQASLGPGPPGPAPCQPGVTRLSWAEMCGWSGLPTAAMSKA